MLYTQFQTKLFLCAVIDTFVIVSFSFGTQFDLSETTGTWYTFIVARPCSLTHKELYLVAGLLTIALLVKKYIEIMYRCSFKGFRVDFYSDQTEKLPQI